MMRNDRGPKVVGRYLGALHRFARRYFATEMERLDLPPVAFPLLMRLLHRDQVSQEDLVTDFLVDKGTVARTLANLEDAGLVTREVDPDDRRIKRVSVTEKARELENDIKAVSRRWDGKLTEGFTDEEREQLLNYLARMKQNARRHWHEMSQTDERREK
ncbi:MAG: MarR family winged helix-turn-helix transcriptional regulator [Armatimonadota bacterium]|jgi:DNA-binding MarR family transcriptional regulator